MRQRQQVIYFGINKNGSLNMFINDPVRRGDYWVGDFYVNSVLQKQLEDAISASNDKLNWESDSQCISISLFDDKECN